MRFGFWPQAAGLALLALWLVIVVGHAGGVDAWFESPVSPIGYGAAGFDAMFFAPFLSSWWVWFGVGLLLFGGGAAGLLRWLRPRELPDG